jgi:hypothetical protein
MNLISEAMGGVPTMVGEVLGEVSIIVSVIGGYNGNNANYGYFSGSDRGGFNNKNNRGFTPCGERGSCRRLKGSANYGREGQKVIAFGL